jgi:hypothetical protein
VLEELRRLELEKLSPLEALNRIAQWKRTLGTG